MIADPCAAAIRSSTLLGDCNISAFFTARSELLVTNQAWRAAVPGGDEQCPDGIENNFQFF